METITKTFELQFDKKRGGAVIRLNDENGCVLRICNVPLDFVFNVHDNKPRDFIDITYPKQR